ncbi:MAG: hypothetical protein M1816_000415 [Peltula sp. TS41687]|nr:MAG: hypothetical protein M1816_000415 [Peltula sp. TS41687]
MLTEYHEVGPRGDIELVLKSHSAPQETPDAPLSLTECDDSRLDLAPLVQTDKDLDESLDPPLEPEEVWAAAAVEDAAVEDAVVEDAAAEDAPTEDAPTEDAVIQDTPDEPEAPDEVVALAEANHPDVPRKEFEW